MKKSLAAVLLAGSLALSNGCASYKVSTPDYIRPDFKEYLTDYQADTLRIKAKEHYLYKIIPLSSEQIKPYDVGHWLTWTFLGNEKSGIFGEDCKRPYSDEIGLKTYLRWYARNPLNNFFGKTIGKREKTKRNAFAIIRANEKFLFMQKDPQPSMFGKTPFSFNLALNFYKPFISLKFPVSKNRQFDFDFGWKPDNTFGIKLRPFTNDGTW